MGVRYVKFGATHVNPSRVLFVTDVYGLAEINVGLPSPIKTGLPIAQVMKMLDEAMADPADTHASGTDARDAAHKAVVADVVRYLEERMSKAAPK
jgi:hypothetical protein